MSGAAGTTLDGVEPSAGKPATLGGSGGVPPSTAGAGVGAENHAVGGMSQPSPTGGAGSAGEPSAAGTGGTAPSVQRRVLLYHFSTLTIDTVPEQLTLLRGALESWGYDVEESAQPQDIRADNLERFTGVAMVNTCFEPFGSGRPGDAEATVLRAFVENGGALFGTHCASVTYQSAEPPHPYNQLLGGRGGDGYFDGESACKTVEAHPTTAALPSSFSYVGNLDNTDFLATDAKVLVRCQWSGGAKKDVAVSWYRTLGGGRVFYSNFAKTAADLRGETPSALHVLSGLRWALGG